MKRTISFTLVLMCFLSMVACGEKAPAWQEQYDLGIRYLSEGNYEEAIIAFTAAIEINPRQALAYVGRGEAYIGSGKTEENLVAAQADYEKAIELDNMSVEVYLGLANVYIQAEDYDRALEILQQGIEKIGDDERIINKISETEQLQSSNQNAELSVVLTYQAAYEADGTLRSYWRYVYGDKPQVEYRHYQKDGTFNEGVEPFRQDYMLTSGTGEFAPTICLDPLLSDDKRKIVQSNSSIFYNYDGADSYAVYTFDDSNNPIAISSFRSDGTLTGTAVLEWVLTEPAL